MLSCLFGRSFLQQKESGENQAMAAEVTYLFKQTAKGEPMPSLLDHVIALHTEVKELRRQLEKGEQATHEASKY